MKFSSTVALATVQILNSHTWLVAIALAGPGRTFTTPQKVRWDSATQKTKQNKWTKAFAIPPPQPEGSRLMGCGPRLPRLRPRSLAPLLPWTAGWEQAQPGGLGPWCAGLPPPLHRAHKPQTGFIQPQDGGPKPPPQAPFRTPLRVQGPGEERWGPLPWQPE